MISNAEVQPSHSDIPQQSTLLLGRTPHLEIKDRGHLPPRSPLESVPDPALISLKVEAVQLKFRRTQSPKLIWGCNLISTPMSSIEISCEPKYLSSWNHGSDVFVALYDTTLLQMAVLKHLKSKVFTHLHHLLLFKAFSPNILRLYVSQIQIPVELGRELNCYKSARLFEHYSAAASNNLDT